jgi:hypothetical protein
MADAERGERKLRGVAMDRAEIEAFLRERGTGTLSLADAGEAYGIPVSFGYDGDRLYFYLIRFGEESTKLDFAATTTRATFSTYSFVDGNDWRSVVVRGPIEEVPEDRLDAAEAAMSDNARFANLFPYGERMTAWPRYWLVPEEVTGQRSMGADG